MITLLIAASVTSFLLTWFSIPSVIAISNEKKLFDVPDSRKLNKTVIPTMGGAGIFIGLTVSSIIFTQTGSTPELAYLLAALIIMFFTGVKDDILILSAKRKLAVQLAVALILVLAGNFRITHTYGLFPAGVFNEALSIPLSVILILFLINAVNLIDGIDGLAAGLGLLIAAFLGGWFYLTGHFNYAISCLALCGSLIAFLRYNLYGGKNKIFMGDTGSLVLGAFLASMMIAFNEFNAAAHAPLKFSRAPLLALALLIVPVTDTLRVFAVRIKNKRSPFSPDMNHLHHLLLKLKMSHIRASAFLILYTAVFVALAASVSRLGADLLISLLLLLGLSFAGAGLIYARVRELETTEAAARQNNNLKLVLNNRPAPNRTWPGAAAQAKTIPLQKEQAARKTGE